MPSSNFLTNTFIIISSSISISEISLSRVYMTLDSSNAPACKNKFWFLLDFNLTFDSFFFQVLGSIASISTCSPSF